MSALGVWLPAVRVGTGVDVFTLRLRDALQRAGIPAEISWLPPRAEWLPASVRKPRPPAWATVAHVNSWFPPRLLPEALPRVVTVHHVVHEARFARSQSLAQRGYHRIHVRRMECANLARAKGITAASRHTAEMAAAVFAVKQRVAVVPHWVDMQQFQPAAARAERGTGDPFRLLYVGTRSRRKGFDLLPDIMRRLGNGFELLLSPAGGGAGRRADWPQNMRPLPGAFPLPQPALVTAYQQADALLLPSRLEGFGLVALEAMACGLPVVAARASALPEVIVDGETGCLVPPEDVSAFVRAVRYLADGSAEHQRMRDAARAHVRSRFSEAKAMSAYIRLYEGALS